MVSWVIIQIKYNHRNRMKESKIFIFKSIIREVFRVSTETSTNIRTIEKVGYASGDLACNLIYATVTTYLLFFYTDIFNINPAAVAFMFLFVRIFDAVTDPIMGLIIDRTNTKFGRFRPYLLFGSVPFAVLAFLCFTTPNFSDTGRLIYAYITYIGLSIAYTIVNVPYGALTPAMTRNNDEIIKLTSARMLFANIGGMIVAFFVPFLSSFIGDRTNNPALGWQMTMAIFGVVGALLIIFCFKSTKERIKVDETQKINFYDMFEQFRVNRPLIILSLIFTIVFGVNAINGSISIFFISYNVDRADLVQWFALANTLPALIIIPLIPKLKNIFGKKGILYVSLFISIIGLVCLMFVPKHNIPLVMICRIVSSIGYLITGAYIWALIPETIDYGYYKLGKRLNGLIYAVIGFFFKCGLALGGIIPGLILNHFGYIANQEQTERALTGILLNATIIPIIFSILAMICFKFYPLDEKAYNKLIIDINNKSKNETEKIVI